MLELGDGACLAESDAILFYLAEGTPFLPTDRLDRARVLQWMFFEQYSHEPYIAVARFWLRHLEMTGDRETMLAEKQEPGRAALAVMEGHLEGTGSSSAIPAPSPTSRSMPTPTSRPRAASFSRTFPGCAPGWSESAPYRAIFRSPAR